MQFKELSNLERLPTSQLIYIHSLTKIYFFYLRWIINSVFDLIIYGYDSTHELEVKY